MALVGYRHARVRSVEAATITALTAINQAQFAYMQTCGNQRYAPTLVSLGTPTARHDARVLSPDLAGRSSGEERLPRHHGRHRGRPKASRPARATAARALPSDRGPLGRGRVGQVLRHQRRPGDLRDTATFAEDMPETGPPGHGAEIK